MIIYGTEKNDKQKALDIVNKSVHRTRAFCIGDDAHTHNQVKYRSGDDTSTGSAC